MVTVFVAKFDMETGTIYSLAYGGKTIIADGNGPKLDALRAFTNNDNWFYSQWFEHGLHNLQHRATNSTVLERTTVRSSWLSLSNRRRRTVLRSKVEPVREKIV